MKTTREIEVPTCPCDKPGTKHTLAEHITKMPEGGLSREFIRLDDPSTRADIDPRTLPAGTVVEWPAADHRGPRVGYVMDDGLWSTVLNATSAVPPEHYDIARVFVPVPKGMGVQEAADVLAKAILNRDAEQVEFMAASMLRNATGQRLSDASDEERATWHDAARVALDAAREWESRP